MKIDTSSYTRVRAVIWGKVPRTHAWVYRRLSVSSPFNLHKNKSNENNSSRMLTHHSSFLLPIALLWPTLYILLL
jgi:hypothetical protein